MGLIRKIGYLAAKLRGERILPPGIRIGNDVHIGDASRFDWDHGRHITICDGAIIAPGVRILCHDGSYRSRVGGTYVAPVTIRERAFVGAEAVLMPGVTIGEGAIVAAGAVVTRSVQPGDIVAGVPAKVIGGVADLDAQRRDAIANLPHFPSAEFDGDDLTAEQDRVLRDAVESYGGYFLT